MNRCRYCNELKIAGFHQSSLIIGLMAGFITGFATYVVLSLT